ncbi:hypothetical protein ACS0TY_014681 [Phlomoides rotata]
MLRNLKKPVLVELCLFYRYGHGPESRRYNQLISVIDLCKGPLRVSMVATLDFHLMVVGGTQITVMFVVRDSLYAYIGICLIA